MRLTQRIRAAAQIAAYPLWVAALTAIGALRRRMGDHAAQP